jgi:hypothetical protein
VSEVIRLQGKKSYLSLACHHTLIEALELVPGGPFERLYAPELEKRWEGVDVSDMSVSAPASDPKIQTLNPESQRPPPKP